MFKIIKDMTFKEKAEYIWEYYKLHILGIILVFFLLFSLVNHYFLNPPPSTYVSIAFSGEYIPDDKAIDFRTHLNDKLIPSEINSIVDINIFYESNDPQIDMSLKVRFAALLMSSDIDILISTKEEFDSLNDNEDIFWDLKEIIPDIENYGEVITDNNAVIGLWLESSNALDEFEIPYKNKILCMPSNSVRADIAKLAIEYLIEG